MPRASIPKSKKPTAKKHRVPAFSGKPIDARFITIGDTDPGIQAKTKLTWAMVVALGVVILSFWLWTLKQNIIDNKNDQSLQKITAEINQTVGELKDIFSQTQKIADYAKSQIDQQNELDNIKQQVLAEIQLNLDSSNWPQHTSSLLKLSLRYPANWSQQETADGLILNSFPAASSTPDIFATVAISKKANAQKLLLANWLKNNGPLADSYTLPTETTLGQKPAVKYTKTNPAEGEVNYLIYGLNDKLIYEIKVASPTGKDIFEPILEKILASVEFIK